MHDIMEKKQQPSFSVQFRAGRVVVMETGKEHYFSRASGLYS